MGYELKPGTTSSIAAGGQYDDLSSTSTQTYAVLGAEAVAAAALSAAAALASQNAAAASATAAATSATNSASSASAAATSATNASTSATNAAASATTATTQAGIATTQATNAATSATSAANSATSASTSATTATTQAGIATTQASNAAASATAAAATLVAVNQVFDNFDDIYLGAKASDPTVDNDGNPLVAGQMYWNTTEQEIRFYNGAVWERPEYSASQSALAAAASAAQAATSATSAATSATNAATSETNAANSATSASTSASTATTQAGIATTQANNAASSATSAATSATNAASSATSAANSASDAADSAAEAAATLASKANNGANTDITSLGGITGGISTVDFVQFDTTPETVPTAPGSLYWDSADGNQTLALVMADGTATQQIGEETYYRVKASSAITNGQVVMFTGTVGASGALTAAPATGLTADTASYVMGIATQDIALNGWGYITYFGLVRGLNTSAFADGTILYYDPSVAGGLTSTVPMAPSAKIQVCAVVNSHASNGSLFVRPAFGGTLGQYEGDVAITTPATNNFLVYNTNKWVNQTPAQARTSMDVDQAGTAVALAIALG